MKSSNISRLIFILLASIGAGLTALPQSADYRVSDTLIAGDTTIVRYTLETSRYTANELSAVLCPKNWFAEWSCPICIVDSVKSYETTLLQDSTYNFYFAVPLGILPGEYQMTIWSHGAQYYSFHPDGTYTIMSVPVIYQQPVNKTVCLGGNVLFGIELIGSDYLNYKWFHNGIELTAATDYTLEIVAVQEQDAGSYYCIVDNDYGKDTSEAAELMVVQVPGNPGPPTGPERFCPGTGNALYSINSDPLATGYTWQLIPEDAGTISQGGTTAEITWDTSFTGKAMLRVALQSELCDPVLSDSLEILIPGPPAPPPICLVGIDEAIGKYRIVWEKPESEAIREYKIYRESNLSDVYLEIGSVAPHDLSVFVDSTSSPDILPHRYKISIVDTCGSVSELSTYHQTMHLTASLGISKDVNLIWSGYEGIPFLAYIIYRGTHPDSMNFLIQVPSTVTSFTDDDPPTGMIYYRVGMSNPAGCLPSKKSSPDYSISMSNTEEVLNPSGITDMDAGKPFLVYPNPAGTELNILLLKNITGLVRYEVYNAIGTLVLEGMIHTGSYRISTGSLPEGIYILKVLTGTDAYNRSFVIQ